jgi:hypothetical protein
MLLFRVGFIVDRLIGGGGGVKLEPRDYVATECSAAKVKQIRLACLHFPVLRGGGGVGGGVMENSRRLHRRASVNSHKNLTLCSSFPI